MISEEDFEIGNMPYREIVKRHYKEFLSERLKDPKLSGIPSSVKELAADKEAETWREDYMESDEGKTAGGIGYDGSWSVRTDLLFKDYETIRGLLKMRRLAPCLEFLRKNFALMKQKKKLGQPYLTEALETTDVIQQVETIKSEDDPEAVVKAYLNRVAAEELSHSSGFHHKIDSKSNSRLEDNEFFWDFADFATRYNTIYIE